MGRHAKKFQGKGKGCGKYLKSVSTGRATFCVCRAQIQNLPQARVSITPWGFESTLFVAIDRLKCLHNHLVQHAWRKPLVGFSLLGLALGLP